MDMPFDPLADLLGLGGDGDDDADNRPFELTAGPYVNHQLRVIGFTGDERINDTYLYAVTFATRLAAEVVFALDGEPACLTVKGVGGHEPRLIQGIIASTSTIGSAPGERGTPRRRYRLTIVPRLWLLTQRRTIRHFQNRTPREIVEKVLSDIGIKPKECRWRLEKEYPKLPFVYQRNETDYDFLRRVLSEAGIFFFFEHASGLLDTLLPGAGAILGAVGSVAGMVGGPMADTVDEAGVATKMLSILTFSDTAAHTPAVEDMAVANELAGEGLKSLASAIGGSAAADRIDENPADSIPYDDEGGAGTDKERIVAFELTKRIRPKKERILDRNVGIAKNWAGLAEAKPIDLSPALGVGLAIGPGGPSVKAHARIDLDIDAPTIPPSMLSQELYQIHAGLREYGKDEARSEVEPGRERAQLELSRDRVDRVSGSGQSDCRRLGAAYRFVLEGHPNGALDREYMVVSLHSEGWAETATADDRIYRNTFECIPSNVCPLPPRWPRPKLEDEIARVVSQEGVRVTPVLATNRPGYVKVRFAWDVAGDDGADRGNLAYGEEYDHAVWVPVSQPWGGDGYGMQCLPREGMDVIIGFLEGQGERPYVKGCVYSEQNHLPFPDEIEHQKIGFRSRTLPENGGQSEISIDDRRGGERVHVRAQRDFDAQIVRESRTKVGRDAFERVGRHSSVLVGGNHHTTIGGIELRDVKGHRRDTVGDSLKTKVGGSADLDVTGNLSETVRGSHDYTVVSDTQLDIAGSRRANVGVEDIVTIGQRHVVSVGSPNEPGRSYMTVVEGTYRRRAKTLIFEADETLVLRSGKTELRLTPDAITLLSKAIASASKELKLRGDGPTLRLDEKAAIYANEIDLLASKAGVHLADKVQIGGSPTLEDAAGPNVLPVRLESRYALELFERAAERLEADEFAAWAMSIYGGDIPVESYRALHRDLLAKSVQNPRIVISSPGSLGGERGTYDNTTREIHIAKELPLSAEADDRDAAALFLVLLHEFGHHVDNLLRKHYTHPPNDGDAPGEEGAKFAYAIAGMDHAERDHVIFAVLTRDGQSVPLELEYTEFHVAVKNYVEKPEERAKFKRRNVETFGEDRGGIPDPAPTKHPKILHNGAVNPHYFGHRSIEDALRDADARFFTNGENGTERVRDKIYFGNWLRDNSQICDPIVLRPLEIALKGAPAMGAVLGHATGREILTSQLHDKARSVTFVDVNPAVEVTMEKLGVYRAEEHIDNPEGLKDERAVDKALRGPVQAEELEVDPGTGIKNYIANDRGKNGKKWATSTGYIKEQLEKAADAGMSDEGYRRLGQALHPIEDLYSHSNFIELTLRRHVSRNVFAWVGERSEIDVRGDKRLPLVTGTFGKLDVIVSLLEGYLEKLDLPIELTNDVFPVPTVEILYLLSGPINQNSAQRPAEEIIRACQDRLGQHQRSFARFIGDSARGIKSWIQFKIAIVANLILQQVTQLEKDFLDDVSKRGGGRTNPTHSMLSKDHPDHPLHEIAAMCAKAAVAKVGLAMRDVWKGRSGVDRAVEVALAYFVHPNDVSLTAEGTQWLPAEVVLRILAFAKARGDVIEALDFKSSAATFYKLSRLERASLARLSDQTIGDKRREVDGVLTLLPGLDPCLTTGGR
ncbi:HET-C-related protein [Pendulispora albinea]|uniref:Phage baseplate assembly protein V n=1 Tax=Pendulispora albinea TaxID=2741071 RepID=A0ABZ2LRH4_9BACT